MGPRLVDHLLYEPEDSGILWIKFNRPERMNALVGTAEENGTVAKVGEYMRAGDDDPDVRVIVLTGVGRGFCSGANLGSKASEDDHRREPVRQSRHARRSRCGAPALLPRVHRAAPRHLADPQADDRDAQRAGGRFGHGHGAALRHPCRLREDALHRLSQCRADHRERRLVLSAQDGRPRPGAGIRLYRRTERRAGLRVGHAQPPGPVREDSEETTRELCERIIARPPLVQWVSKRVMRAALDSTLETTMVLTSNAGGILQGSEDAKEARRAFDREAKGPFQGRLTCNHPDHAGLKCPVRSSRRITASCLLPGRSAAAFRPDTAERQAFADIAGALIQIAVDRARVRRRCRAAGSACRRAARSAPSRCAAGRLGC